MQSVDGAVYDLNLDQLAALQADLVVAINNYERKDNPEVP